MMTTHHLTTLTPVDFPHLPLSFNSTSARPNYPPDRSLLASEIAPRIVGVFTCIMDVLGFSMILATSSSSAWSFNTSMISILSKFHLKLLHYTKGSIHYH